MEAQGWYRDPWDIHNDRWFSARRPTDLVRDDGVESRDSPPNGEVAVPLRPAEQAPADSSDAKRADAATRRDQSYDARKAFWAVLDRAFGQGPVS
jgi:hypothetical protein